METPSSATHGNCGGSCGWVPVGGNGLCLRGHSKGRWSGGSLRRCLAPVGQGALPGCGFDAVCPAGKGTAEWRAGFWRVAEGSRVSERFPHQETSTGAPGDGFAKSQLSVPPAAFSSPTIPQGGTAGSTRTRSRVQDRLSSKCNSLEEDLERRAPAKTLAWPVVDQIQNALKFRL